MRFLLSTLLLGSLAGFASGQAAQSTSDPSRAPMLDQRRLRQAISRLASQHPELVSVLNVGESRTGSKIEALRIAGGAIAPGRPGILIVANIDGPAVYTSGIALGHAQALVEGYGDDERVTELLDRATIYVIPRANPDAAEGYFASPRHERRASGHGVDNDRDGRNGEDDPEDVNGDGFVSMMRVPDPAGTWIEDPTDARATVEADANRGERGRWKLVVEGRDRDGDGEASEDPRLDAWVNRNWAQDWKEHAPEAGLFPTDEPEVRGLCEFVLAHKDIQLVITYGESHNMGGKLDSVKDDAPASKRVPPSGLRASDAALLEDLGKAYRSTTENDAPSTAEPGGSFEAWCYGHRGLFSIAITPWTLPLDSEGPEAAGDPDSEGGAGEPAPDEAGSAGPDGPGARKGGGKKDDDAPEPGDDAKRLKWIDAEGEAEQWRHLGWTVYEHPELGAVQIGGFAPFARTDPPAAERAGIAERELDFLLEVGERLATVRIEDARARALGGGLLEVEARIENAGYLPILSTWGKETRATRPALVELHLPKGAELLAGSRKRLISELDGSGGHEELHWLVRGANAAAIGIHVETDHAGAARAIPEVQR